MTISKHVVWEDSQPPKDAGYYWVQWAVPNGSKRDGPAEIEWVDPADPGWTINVGRYSWTLPHVPKYTGGMFSKEKLRPEDVRKIRALEGQLTGAAVGKIFGITNTSVYAIWTGRCWKGVA